MKIGRVLNRLYVKIGMVLNRFYVKIGMILLNRWTISQNYQELKEETIHQLCYLIISIVIQNYNKYLFSLKPNSFYGIRMK